MLRVHFTDADLARTRVAAAPDPMWETATSLHRFQTRRGRVTHAEWYRTARHRLRERGLGRAVRTVLLPLFPRAAYFPDFLTPPPRGEGLSGALEAVLDTPPSRVRTEVALLDRIVGAPSWAAHLTDKRPREELVRTLRAYYDAAIAPYEERMQAGLDAERTVRCRRLLDSGNEGMLTGLSPALRWRYPVLHAEYPVEKDLVLNGRGLLLVPSYFCWRSPVAFADPELPPVLVYPLAHDRPAPRRNTPDGAPAPALTSLLGRTRADVLSAAYGGATTGEIARSVGVSASSASRHVTVLRDAGMIASARDAATVLHTLTPAGVSLLRAGGTRVRGSAAGGAAALLGGG
ncbi:helix-turn-helix domain-containing protein [Streptomyces enissocaesilis]|uniref:Winged helix-turn-helix domain-containing protein n=1 Tax=Streptomyces enissocaesilis TaxID=332589 RepID=A0ABP6K1A5_9ACTN